jgi:hypothetical protein
MPGIKIGIRTISIVPAAVTTISNTVLATISGLTFPVLAGSLWSLRFYLPFSVGATGGIKLQLIIPATPTFFVMSWKLIQFGTPGTLLDAATQTTSTAIANAAAGAGTNYFEAEATVQNALAGNISMQFAQNSSVAATLTMLQGGFMDVVQL